MKKIEGWLQSDRGRAGEGGNWLEWGWLHHDHVIDNRQGAMEEKMAMGKNGREMPLAVNSDVPGRESLETGMAGMLRPV